MSECNPGAMGNILRLRWEALWLCIRYQEHSYATWGGRNNEPALWTAPMVPRDSVRHGTSGEDFVPLAPFFSFKEGKEDACCIAHARRFGHADGVHHEVPHPRTAASNQIAALKTHTQSRVRTFLSMFSHSPSSSRSDATLY